MVLILINIYRESSRQGFSKTKSTNMNSCHPLHHIAFMWEKKEKQEFLGVVSLHPQKKDFMSKCPSGNPIRQKSGAWLCPKSDNRVEELFALFTSHKLLPVDSRMPPLAVRRQLILYCCSSAESGTGRNLSDPKGSPHTGLVQEMLDAHACTHMHAYDVASSSGGLTTGHEEDISNLTSPPRTYTTRLHFPPP